MTLIKLGYSLMRFLPGPTIVRYSSGWFAAACNPSITTIPQWEEERLWEGEMCVSIVLTYLRDLCYVHTGSYDFSLSVNLMYFFL